MSTEVMKALEQEAYSMQQEDPKYQSPLSRYTSMSFNMKRWSRLVEQNSRVGKWSLYRGSAAARSGGGCTESPTSLREGNFSSLRNQSSFLLIALAPDIAIIAECANVTLVRGKAPRFLPTSAVWIGDNQHKGLSVFTFGPFTAKQSKIYKDRFAYILPIRIDGPAPFSLLAVWACHAHPHSTNNPHTVGWG
jgi:hypothetical protein